MSAGEAAQAEDEAGKNGLGGKEQGDEKWGGGRPERQQAPVETPVSLPAQPSLRRALV